MRLACFVCLRVVAVVPVLHRQLQDTLGPDIWFGVETQCSYTDKNGTTSDVFDAGEAPKVAVGLACPVLFQ
jgi:hypothetical protein